MYNKDMELKSGLMDPNMLDNILMVKKKYLEYSLGLMDQDMKENFTLMILMVKVHINGLMVENIQVIG